MLFVATTVFLYYTVWTLLMVRPHFYGLQLCSYIAALCRSRSSFARSFSTSSLGHSHTRHPHPVRMYRCRNVYECGHDSKQPKTSGESGGSREEKGMIGFDLAHVERWHYVSCPESVILRNNQAVAASLFMAVVEHRPSIYAEVPSPD